ncbi:hypothetical protein VULLAG_LOCUS2757 [Vulpes lagopus]
MVKDQNGTIIIMTHCEVTFVRVCDEGSRLREWPGGLRVQSSVVLGENRLQPTGQARSPQRRDLRPAVSQAGGGGASRTVQSGEPPERTCGRRAVDGGDCVPSLLAAGAAHHLSPPREAPGGAVTPAGRGNRMVADPLPQRASDGLLDSHVW